MGKIVVGMSGGVDSSVTAALLRRQGHQVIGLFMKNWEEKDEDGVCTAQADYRDVARVCERLDIPFYSVNFSKEYWERVFADFLSELKKGRTPNPDVLCNREIKFDILLSHAKALGGELLATGHYAQTRDGKLYKASDLSKDQSYFLHLVSAERLKDVCFPLGSIPKTEVREIARDLDLATAEKKDSTGICFIGERNFPEFVSKYIKPKRGHFMKLSGEVVGEHDGVQFYTLGQRRGLGLGGEGSRWFVVQKDNDRNIVYVERGDHPALYANVLEVEKVDWISGKEADLSQKLQAKIRYRQNDQTCQVEKTKWGYRVVFDVPQRAITPGQSVVFYREGECLGGGVIERSAPSL